MAVDRSNNYYTWFYVIIIFSRMHKVQYSVEIRSHSGDSRERFVIVSNDVTEVYLLLMTSLEQLITSA